MNDLGFWISGAVFGVLVSSLFLGRFDPLIAEFWRRLLPSEDEALSSTRSVTAAERGEFDPIRKMEEQ